MTDLATSRADAAIETDANDTGLATFYTGMTVPERRTMLACALGPALFVPNAQYDMPNMDAVRRETRRLDDPRADYPLAVQARDARTEGAYRRSRPHTHAI